MQVLRHSQYVQGALHTLCNRHAQRVCKRALAAWQVFNALQRRAAAEQAVAFEQSKR